MEFFLFKFLTSLVLFFIVFFVYFFTSRPFSPIYLIKKRVFRNYGGKCKNTTGTLIILEYFLLKLVYIGVNIELGFCT